ncbi:outer membrane protein assembly factor BamC [Teredinibacter haidensis]|uniref:outer membrane protein assembly factor BamC n=1 Tax=Teredinibacter haidensis TaxID=2731755 RepID=UPI0009489B5A|nr:outer membrane protein assembly factor BamC [Teredinibacter haidensis]
MMFNQRFIASTLFRSGLILSLVWLCGCSTFFGKHGVFRGRGNDYLAAAPIKGLALPEGIQSVLSEPMYPVPDVNAVDEFGDPVNIAEYKVPRPLPLGDKGEIGVKIQKLGDERWIYLNASTAQVWPRTQYFLSQFDLDIARSNATAGIIETNWMKFTNDEVNAVRFQIHLSKGIHPETSEIHVLHMQRSREEAANNPNQPWPKTSDDTERESWLLGELAKTLAESVDNSSASLLGQNVGGDLKAGFTRDHNEPTLSIRLPNSRAWATISHSAKKEGFKTWEADSDLGLLYVGYAPYDEDGEGFFSKLAFWSKKKGLPDTAPHKMAELLANLDNSTDVMQRFNGVTGAAFSGLKLAQAQGYLLVVSPNGAEILVNIRDFYGNRLPDGKAKDFLRLLRKNLI